jgi:hypothetical protein
MKLRMGRAYARLGAAAALAVAGSLAAAVPAFAADDQADLAVSVATTAVVAGSDKPVVVTVTNNGPATAIDVKITIDTTKLDTGKVKVALPGTDAGCAATGDTVVVCDVAEILPGGHEKAGFDITGLSAGDAGTFKASVASATADADMTNNEAVQSISVKAEPSSVDMVAIAEDVYSNYDTKAGVPAGASAPLFFAFINTGNAAADGLDFHVTLPQYVSFAKLPSYCTVTKGVAACHRPDIVVPMDGMLSVDKDAFTVRVAANAPGPMALTGGLVDVSAAGVAAPSVEAPRQLSGFTLRSATKSELSDADQGDNSDAFSVFDAPSHLVDLFVTTKPVEGAVGETVKLPVTIGNKSAAEAPNAVLTVVAPTGTRIVGGTDGCVEVTKGKKYTCEAGTVPGDVEVSGDFSLKILSAEVGTDGYVSFTSEAPDAHPADNTAKIVITMTGGSGGGLPVTGARAGLIGGAGGAVLLAGLAVLVMARRRRVVMVTPTDGAGE